MPHVKVPAKTRWYLIWNCPRGCGGLRGGFLDADALVGVGQDAGELGEVELVGLVLGQSDEQVLGLADATGGGGRVQLVAVGGQLLLVLVGQYVGVQQPVQRDTGGVVQALALAGLVGAPHPMGFLVGVR